MKILVLGSSGFVGKNFIKFSKNKKKLLTTSYKNDSNLKFDITKDNIENLFKSKKIDRVLILCAKSNPQECKLKV